MLEAPPNRDDTRAMHFDPRAGITKADVDNGRRRRGIPVRPLSVFRLLHDSDYGGTVVHAGVYRLGRSARARVAATVTPAIIRSRRRSNRCNRAH